jgi:hypothetical protein
MPKMKMKITRSLSSMRGLLLWLLWSSEAQKIKASQILSGSFKWLLMVTNCITFLRTILLGFLYSAAALLVWCCFFSVMSTTGSKFLVILNHVVLKKKPMYYICHQIYPFLVCVLC